MGAVAARHTAFGGIRKQLRISRPPRGARPTFGENRKPDTGVHFARPIAMARIRRRLRHDGIRITISGRLAASDMGRLEHACAPALLERAAALDIDLRAVTDLDASARAVLARLALRGAHVEYPPELVTSPSPTNGVLAPGGHDTASKRSSSCN
jgi:hypothetical protein